MESEIEPEFKPEYDSLSDTLYKPGKPALMGITDKYMSGAAKIYELATNYTRR